MSIISSADTGGESDLPEIANSLRLDGTNDYLSRTQGAGDAKTWVCSFWIKRSKLGADQAILTTLNGNWHYLVFGNDDKMYFNQGGVGSWFVSSEVFRDVSSHYHITIAMDSTQAMALNRFKLFVNGVVSSLTFPVAMGLNGTTFINTNGISLWVGDTNGLSQKLDGYLSHFSFIGGYPTGVNQSNWASTNLAALFAYTDPNGQWRSLSKAALTSLASAGGTNSFFLPFDNGSSTTTLGQDASSKGNNWTLTNMVRDGSVNDCWSYDTPTNNFATLNPLAKATNDSASNGALLFTGGTGGTVGFCPSSIAMSSGKWYWEVVLGSAVGNSFVGIVDISTSNSGNLAAGAFPGGYDYRASSGNKCNNSSLGAAYGASYTSGDVIGVAFDSTNGKLFFAKNGTWQASGDPVAGTNAAFTGLTSIYYPEVGHDSYADPSFSINFGQRPVSGGVDDRANSGGYFRYAPPSGFKALCTKNLSSSGSVTTSGTFTGNAAADGPFVWLNGTPTAMTIDGNAVTWGTHADKLASGFKIRTASSPYNDAAINSYTVTVNDGIFKYNNAEKNP